MKDNNDIKCHLQKISSCEHYGYLMDCPIVTLHFLPGSVRLLFPSLITWINARKQLLILLGQNIAPSQGGFLTPL